MYLIFILAKYKFSIICMNLCILNKNAVFRTFLKAGMVGKSTLKTRECLRLKHSSRYELHRIEIERMR